MKIEVENLNGQFKKLTIEVPAETVDRHLDTHFKGIQKEADLKGFRKGKVPMAMVRQTFGAQEMPRVAQNIVQDAFNKAVVEKELSPVANPDIKLEGAVIDGAPLKFTAEFEHLPKIELKEYEGYKTAKPEFEVSEKEIEDTLKNIQQRMTDLNKLDDGEALTEGRVCKMDFEGFEGDEKLENTSQQDALIEPGNGQLVEGFDKAIVGLKAGDKKEFDVTFPEKQEGSDEPHPLGGKNVHFKVEIKEVYEKNVPELNDEFATKAGPFKSLEELKEGVRTEVRTQKEADFRKETQEKAVEWLIEKNPLTPPETLVNQQIQNLAVEAGMQLQNMGLDQDKIEGRLAEWEKEMTKRAEDQVRASLLLGAVAREKNIQVEDEDIRKELGRMATQMRKDPQEIVKDMQEKNMIPGFMRQVQEMKALEWLLDNAMS